ncbi:MAG: amino acid permease [Bacteroidales bacterium]|nr:amino acid permease [Bacteroidales bacterium]
MAFFALSIVPIGEVKELYENTLLSHMGDVSGGAWLALVVSIDAVLVLSGAVLTSFVGVSGLLDRMTLNRVLPPFFLKKNKRGSSHRIIISFLILGVSVLLLTKGEVTVLAGVYTISFLAVMALFVIGNMFLKSDAQNFLDRNMLIG